MATRLTQTGEEVQEILNKSTVSEQNIENVFGSGGGTNDILTAEQWLAAIKEYVDSGNVGDIYLMDHFPAVGESLSGRISQMLASKMIVVKDNDGKLFSIMTIMKIIGSDYYSMFGIKEYLDDDYTSQINYHISSDSAGNVVSNIEERDFLMNDTANRTFLKIAEATRDYLKKEDASSLYMPKSGGTFTRDVYFSGGMTSQQGRFYDVVTHHAPVDMDGKKIINLGPPTNNTDAAPKGYVDTAISNAKEIFWATYGTTTYSEVLNAFYEGKIVCMHKDDHSDDLMFYCTDDDYSGGYFVFTAFTENVICRTRLSESDVWEAIEYFSPQENNTAVFSGIKYLAIRVSVGLSPFAAIIHSSFDGTNKGASYMINYDGYTSSVVNLTESVNDVDHYHWKGGLDENDVAYLELRFNDGTTTFDAEVLVIGQDVPQTLNKISGNSSSRIVGDAVDDVDVKLQEKLVSGTNIKTFAGQSLLSSGDVIQKVVIPAGNHLVMPNGTYVAIIKYAGVTMLFTTSTDPGANILRLQGEPADSTPDTDKVTYDFGSQSFHFGTIGGSAGTASVMFVSGTAVTASASNSSVSGPQSSPVILQDKLVSGTNIKTVNNTSLLGSGNIPIHTEKDYAVNYKNSTQYIENRPGGFDGYLGQSLNQSCDWDDSELGSYVDFDYPGLSSELHLDFNIDEALFHGLLNGQLTATLYGEDELNDCEVTGEITVVWDVTLDAEPIFRVNLTWASYDTPPAHNSVVFNSLYISGSEIYSVDGEDYYLPVKFQKKYIPKELPSGGTTGQVLTKTADATAWGDVPKEVFWATYNSTTYQDVLAAYLGGKVVYCIYQDRLYEAGYYIAASDQVRFFSHIGGSTAVIILKSSGWSSGGSYTYEASSNKVSTISGNETDTTKYPNTKAVADALGKWGVISQTQTWTTEPGLNTPGVYQMSNHNLGIIPQAFIDLAESIGATFNPNGYQAGVGYFELNGLTDLSYEEMIDVYNLVGVVQNFASWGGTALRALKKSPRTLPPVSNRGNTQYSFNYAFRVATQGTDKTYLESVGIGTESTDLLISNGFSEMLYNALYLRYFGVNGALKPNSSSASFSLAFQNCHSLTSVRIYGLCQNIDFAGTYFKPAIDLASIVYMVENAANTAAITIKVSPTTYGYCQADTTEYTYQGNTYTGILALATAHNISIGQV